MRSGRFEAKQVQVAGSTPPELMFVLGAISQYLGAALAFSLFDDLGVGMVATLRVIGAAFILIVLRRSWNRSFKDLDMYWTAAFGIVLAGMNLCFYLAIEELPLGNAVAIEFIGPIAVAAAGRRSVRNLISLLIAALGVFLLAEVTPEGTVTGFLFALLAGTLWALYIILGSKVARTGAHLDGLGIGMLIGGLVISPASFDSFDRIMDSPILVLLALLTGLLANVIPYGIDQLVFRKISKSRFAFLQSLLPATAMCIGIIALGQRTSLGELFGISLIIFAIVIRRSEKES